MKKYFLLVTSFVSLVVLSGCGESQKTQAPAVQTQMVTQQITQVITQQITEQITQQVKAEEKTVEQPKVAPVNMNDTTYPGYPLKFDTKKYDANVKKIQTRLNKIGYNLTVDGYFGQNTLDAVLYIQEQNGLEMDGIVGPLTWDALFNNTLTIEEGELYEGDY